MFRVISYHERFGKLRYLQDVAKINKNRRAEFICDCGKIHVCQLHNAVVSKNANCGCEAIKNCAALGRSSKRHGMTYTPEWTAWTAIKRRCLNSNTPEYPNYGGRGISVCQRWLDKFENFYEDIGVRPSKKHSIDRIDVNGNYEPSNCRWATVSEQQNNRRNNVRLEFNGLEMTISEWAKRLRMNNSIIESRLRKGWSIEAALTYPKFSRYLP